MGGGVVIFILALIPVHKEKTKSLSEKRIHFGSVFRERESVGHRYWENKQQQFHWPLLLLVLVAIHVTEDQEVVRG